jgi:hypothetical protein
MGAIKRKSVLYIFSWISYLIFFLEIYHVCFEVARLHKHNIVSVQVDTEMKFSLRFIHLLNLCR